MSIARKRGTVLRLANFVASFAFAAGLVWGQIAIPADAARRAALEKRFEGALRDHHDNPLTCHVEPMTPRLAYSFRFFTGFYATFPARQLSRGKDNRIVIFFRVRSKPGAGEYQYFFHPTQVPDIPENPGKTQLEVGGGFYVGEGSYGIDWLMVDQKDRTCARSWTIKASRAKTDLLVPPGSITALGLDSWKGFAQKPNDSRVTILLSAMPIYRRRNLSRLSPYDRSLLLSSLTSILNSSKYGHARVVAFDLLGKRVLFEQDEFDSSGYQRLLDTLDNASYGTIDARVLSKGVTNRELFEGVIKKEIDKAPKSDAVIILGAEGPPADKLPPVFSEYRDSLSARLYYIFFARFPQPVEDIMYQFVRAGKGRVFRLFNPPDLVNAIKAISAGA